MLIRHGYCHSSIWKFLYSSYHTLKLKNIVILDIAFSPLISKFYRLATWIFFGLVIQFKFFWRYVETMCQLQLLLFVILLITVLVSHNVTYLEYFIPMSHGVKKRAPTTVSPPPVALTNFHQSCCFISNTLSTFFCSDLADYCKNNTFSK